MGTEETLGSSCIQFMTAGKGVRHSEHNLNESNPLRFIQMWLTPRSRGLPPNYGSATGDAKARRAGWHHIVSDVQDASTSTAVQINTDANMFVTDMDAEGNGDRELRIEEGRQAYMLCVDGQVQVKGGDAAVSLQRHDACEIVGPLTLKLSTWASHAMLIVLKAL